MRNRVFIGVGSNEGDRLAHISSAIKALGAVDGVHVVQMATIIETGPVGGPPQDPYLNTVVEIDTALAPHELLSALKTIEQQLGRKPQSERWGPRPIDLDILLYGDTVLNDSSLIIPHPRMHLRRFVLEPLAQLAPDLIHPFLGRTVSSLLIHLPADHAHPVSP
ncbi:MAG: 2-amino-4-hydroxy-6-hydroxymethyldihydropteridine diphosphokinase [Candidatus Omnitrophica bacterium]|nr:2-amino-4-hydroxy-6-hydroxymethyldihydropteridine diphosphokinase [Candidatus Omnitrophota bacterium]